MVRWIFPAGKARRYPPQMRLPEDVPGHSCGLRSAGVAGRVIDRQLERAKERVRRALSRLICPGIGDNGLEHPNALL
jgi:hypothetical protein